MRIIIVLLLLIIGCEKVKTIKTYDIVITNIYERKEECIEYYLTVFRLKDGSKYIQTGLYGDIGDTIYNMYFDEALQRFKSKCCISKHENEYNLR